MDLVHVAGEEIYDGFPGMGLLRFLERARHAVHGNTRSQARRNIAARYDLGNDVYRLWLDETMPVRRRCSRPGRRASRRRRAPSTRALDEMGAKPGDHVLEIGCGWGGFAEFAAAERGLRATGLTISRGHASHGPIAKPMILSG